jgi:RHS repeat-associated protein
LTSNVTRTTSYTYNQDGSISAIAYPSGRTLKYTYGGAGRPLSAIDPTGPINYVSSATYAPHGALATYTSGSVSGGFTGITTVNTYNKRLQPVLISAASPTATILSLCYDFHSYTAINLPPCIYSASTTGDNGNVYQIANNRDSNRTQNFNYDDLNRINQGYTSGTNWGEDFTVDAWSNLTNRALHMGKTNYEPLNVAPASNLNRLPGFGYDAAGNMTSNGSVSYTYSVENQLINATGAVYVYDGDGQRVKKNSSGVTLYWLGGSGSVLDETSSTGTLVSEYILFDGKRVARRDSDNSVKYYFSDNISSASVITNATGAMPPLAESDYYPYGGEIPITAGDTNHYKFTGKERDAESGLDNFGARYDSSSLGRFMTPDWAAKPTTVPYATFGDPQTLNLYSYVENGPLNRIDADGHKDNGAADPSGHTDPCGKDSQKECTDQQKKAESQNANTMPFPLLSPIVLPALDVAAGATVLVTLPAAGMGLAIALPPVESTGDPMFPGYVPAPSTTGTPPSTSQQGAVNTDPITSSRSTLPRDAAGNYAPHPDAQGAHSTVGTRVGSDGKPYRQGATFDSNGRFTGRTDVTNHGRSDHANPHFHPATGPASVRPGPGEPVPQD